MLFLTRSLEVEGFVQIIEFSPSPLEDEQVKVYFSILTWGRTERGGETISFLNVYKYVLLFFFSW